MSLPGAAITGLGAVHAAGVGLDGAARWLAAGATPPLSEIDRGAGFHRDGGARSALLVRDFDAGAWVPRGKARRMGLPSKLAVAAARMAVDEAGLEPDALAAGTTAVALATAFGPCEFSERLLRQIFARGPEAASPFLFTESVANAAAAQIALTLGARGANVTVTQREAGGLIALERAARELALGRARTVVAGAVEEMTPLLHAVLDRFEALSRCRDGDREAARPFDRRRSGFLAADGAVVAVLEDEGAARARGAPLLARWRPLGGAFDPGASRAGWGRDPEPLASALAALLERAGVAPRGIDAVVSGASGARAGDRLEALVLRRVWGDLPLPPVVAPKAVLGEHAGAGLLAGVLAVRGAAFGPTPGFGEVDPELALRPHAGGGLDGGDGASRVLVSALAAGGAAAWALVERAGR